MKARSWIACLVFPVAVLGSEGASACPFTPPEWQQPVGGATHAETRLSRTGKHVDWIRDLDKNFIDDEIQARFHQGQKLDVIVELNRCLNAHHILEPNTGFAHYGRVSYVGRLVSFLMLDGVRFETVRTIAARPDVAMVEWRSPLLPMDDVSSRAVQSRSSASPSANTKPGYGAQSAEAQGRTGKGINIAILDSGVSDVFIQGGVEKHPKSFDASAGTPRFVAGFDALKFEDLNLDGANDDPAGDPADGKTNPIDDYGHGTNVAGIALGELVAAKVCRDPGGGPPANCAGVAPDAGLVDVRIYDSALNHDQKDLAEGLDWIGDNAEQLKIGVANLSYANCVNDDGNSAIPQLIDAVVSLGVTVAVALGNSSKCNVPPGTTPPGKRRVSSYPSSSLAITVAASNDQGTVRRGKDLRYDGCFTGPRKDFDITPSLAALKPDIAAPGVNIFAATFNTTEDVNAGSGTSMAAPHVAGAAALVLEARPTIPPASLKKLLKATADAGSNMPAQCERGVDDCTCSAIVPPPSTAGLDPNWDVAFGSGLLNAFAALTTPVNINLGFPSCAPPTGGQANALPATSTAGTPCALRGGQPWNNSKDLQLESDQITVLVKNPGTEDATVDVNFGVYPLAIGNRRFYAAGTQRRTIPAGQTVQVPQPLPPDKRNYPSVQVTIDFGSDADFSNNISQRSVAAVSVTAETSLYDVQIDNPFPSASKMKLTAKSDKDGWTCKVDPQPLNLVPFKSDPPDTGVSVKVRVRVAAPVGAHSGDTANCNVTGTATDNARRHKPWTGGVTLQLTES